RHEGLEEGHHHPESQDCGAHAHRAPRAGAHPPVALPRHPPLRLPDRHQAPPHPGYTHADRQKYTRTLTHTQHTHNTHTQIQIRIDTHRGIYTLIHGCIHTNTYIHTDT